MGAGVSQRLVLTALGAVAGAALWLLTDSLPALLFGTAALALTVYAWVFAVATLLLAGPMPPARAASSAALVAVVMAGLAALAGRSEILPFDTLDRPLHWLAGLVVVFVPLPFLIAAGRAEGWRHYATLFTESWGLVVRGAAAGLFTGFVWGLIALSDALLRIVGITLLDWLWSAEVLVWIVTGGVLGLSLAVVGELGDVLSPALVLRLFRLLVVPVLAVMALFILALPFSGLSGLLGGVSVTLTLLAMIGAAATLLTAALDRDDGMAAHGAVMRQAMQALALLLPVPAVLAAYALWLRVDQYGWTPDRVFAAVIAVLGLGYGFGYALAVIRRRHWMARIRAVNTGMALALVALAALWLTPLLDAQRIAAQSQLSRFEAGLTPVEALDVPAIDGWGRAGADARARLAEIAATPGQEALAALLADPYALPDETPEGRAALLATLAGLMPLQPPAATATRDMLLQAIPAGELQRWIDACRAQMPDGRAGCVFAVADLWPAEPGEEALVVLRDASGWVDVTGIGLRGGVPTQSTAVAMDGALVDPVRGEALLRALQDAPAPVTPAPLNRIGRGAASEGWLLLP
jgi:hypothetical protein